MIQILESNNFEQEINKGEVALVDFFATWCAPCRMLAPVFEELSDELDGSVNCFKVDIDQSLDLARNYGINTVPTMLVFKNGEVAEQIVGFLPKEAIKSKVEAHL